MATNRIETLDPALIRPGIQRCIYMYNIYIYIVRLLDNARLMPTPKAASDFH